MNFRSFAAIVAILSAAPASAWGDRGHRAIADIAWTQLSPGAQREVAGLLEAAPALATPLCAVGSFEDGSTWADCVRSRYRERFSATATWHYVNVSVCQPFRLPDEGQSKFLVSRYKRELAILADRRNPLVVRLEALMWVAHLAGDLHQPLHVGDAGDRGGNEVNVYPQSGRYPLNLHSEWDRVLVNDAIDAAAGGVAGFAAAAADPDNQRRWRASSPAAWARESWELARRVAYVTPQARGPCGGAGAVVDVGDNYVVAAVPVVGQQLERAGVRLAAALNRALIETR